MNTTEVLFNRNPLVYTGTIEQPTSNEIKRTFGLWNASLEDAMRYGGDITRAAIKAMNLRFDRKHIIVDTKIHMLISGMSPSIPGWHVDGAPRDNLKNPNGSGLPDTFAQEGDSHFNRYHILVSGTGCLTKFIKGSIRVPIPSEPSTHVYAMMSKFVQAQVQDNKSCGLDMTTDIPSCQVVEFDWWDIHTGVIATKKEWRYLIRVCESDYYEPQTELRDIIRMQSQVYSPTDFGW
jgi:hypothetical protein